MKLSQEELFILSQIYEDGMDKKSIIEELNNIDEEGNFLKVLIERIEHLNEKELKVILNDEIQLLRFNLKDLEE